MADAEPIKVRRGPADLARRSLVAVVLTVVAIGALWAGGFALWLLAAAIALVSAVEWSRLVAGGAVRTAAGLVLLAVAMALALPSLWGTDRATVALLLIGALLLMLVPRTGAMALGVAYAGLAAIGLLFLRDQPNGFLLALWALALVWATDTGAYFAGHRIGGAKLAPRISPNKTWAGLIGGVVAAAIVGALISAFGHLPAATLWLAAPLALIAQGGDLLESWLKRRAGVKDSSRIIPGHGGVLDRVDGMLPVMILVAALIANGTN